MLVIIPNDIVFTSRCSRVSRYFTAYIEKFRVKQKWVRQQSKQLLVGLLLTENQKILSYLSCEICTTKLTSIIQNSLSMTLVDCWIFISYSSSCQNVSSFSHLELYDKFFSRFQNFLLDNSFSLLALNEGCYAINSLKSGQFVKKK